MLTPEAQAVIDRRKQEQHERMDGRRLLFDTAYTRGDMALAEPGCELWSRDAWDALSRGDRRLNAEGEPRGGVILDITSARDVTDDGEIIERRAFLTYDYTSDRRRPDLAFTTLTEAQVAPDSFTAPSIPHIRQSYRRLCWWVGEQHGTASSFETGPVAHAIWRLAGLLSQRTP